VHFTKTFSSCVDAGLRLLSILKTKISYNGKLDNRLDNNELR
jgi:hypothetical protein